ncbi:hypothetical protein GCM10018962_52230 [Dactylosporangium matsuzakiense]|uniref:Putative restriction endonuclease domain-containing protein n=2 Tax=Dactylosporangium matsuzakiense TaxID=53360 RepID=A0A9W6NSC4_9ACTN|nr:hypothetical protein GCM10017581_087530 [Dactylosporangium matsuzakiense]
MPTHVTLDDLARMAATDENHRYELSPEGVLSVTPPADREHARLVSRIYAWFLANGYDPDDVLPDCGIDVGGGRVPDLTVWANDLPSQPGRASYDSPVGLLLAVEVVSRSSEIIDRVIKKAEYAKAGIPRYWFVERDSANTVHRHVLNAETGEYEPVPGDPQPLAWLLTTVPDVR